MKEDAIKIFLDTTRSKGLHPDLGWKTLPIKKEELDRILEATGIDYVISGYDCPYFKISKYDDLKVLNKVAEIIGTLEDQEKLLLKAWCDRHESGMPDLGEIGNAALQIGQIEYLPGVKNSKDLGRYLAGEAGLTSRVKSLVKDTVGISRDCLDYEDIGEAYEVTNGGYYIYGLDEKQGIQGYVANDRDIDEFRYSKWELAEMEIKDAQRDPIHECMNRTAQKRPGLEHPVNPMNKER